MAKPACGAGTFQILRVARGIEFYGGGAAEKCHQLQEMLPDRVKSGIFQAHSPTDQADSL